MKAALASWQREMKKAASSTATRNEIEPDLRKRLGALTEAASYWFPRCRRTRKPRCGNCRISSAWSRPRA